MNTALITNLVLAAFAITFLLQFLSQRKQAKIARIELQKYQNQLQKEVSRRQDLESAHQTESNNPDNNDSKSIVNSLLSEVENLHHEKDQELKMRLEAEKQIDLAIQKTSDVQSKIDDWKLMQEANLKDATDIIKKVGNDLYERLIKSQKQESELIGNKVDETVKSIHDYLEKIVKQVQFLNLHNVDTHKAVNAAININGNITNVDGNSRNLENILRSAHLQVGIDYFMHHNLPEEFRKSVLCETIIVLDPSNVIIVDIKSAKFFLELFSGRSRKDPDIEGIFKQKIDRYLVYLTNPKYRSNILDYFSKHGIINPDSDTNLVMLVPSQKEVEAFKKLGEQYLDMLEENNIVLHSLRSFSNVIFGE